MKREELERLPPMGDHMEIRECPHCEHAGWWRKDWHPDECPICYRVISTGQHISELS